MSITLDNVSKIYRSDGQDVSALNGIYLNIKPGEFMGLVGASGSGKTTLLNLLGCIDRASGGNIRFDKQNLTDLSEKNRIPFRKKTVGYIFQFFNLVPTLTAQENVDITFWDWKDGRIRFKENINQLFDELGMTAYRHRFPNQLSGGQEQRVAIIRALAHNPKVILADEPTGNLDSKTGLDVVRILQKKCCDLNASCVVSTHDPSLLEFFDRIVFIRDGRIEKIQEQTRKTP